MRALTPSRLRAALLMAALLAATAAPAAAQANLSVAVSATPTTQEVGQTVTYTVTVANAGPNNANSITVGGALTGAAATVVSWTPSQGSVNSTTGVWSVGTLQNTRSATVAVVVRPTAVGSVTLTSSITGSSQSDPVSTNNSGSATITATAAPGPGSPICYVVADAGGSGGGDDRLARVWRATGVETAVGAGTGTSGIEAMAYWPGNTTLYAANGGTFGTLNHTTGVFSSIGSIGNARGSAGTISMSDVDGLTFDPFSGILYGSHRRGSADDLLFRINPATGAVVPDAFGTGVDYLVVPSTAAVGFGDIDDLAVSSTDGRLYAIANNGGSGDRLIIINRTTGAVTDVGALAQNDMEGLDFAPDGLLYGTTGTGGGANSNRFSRVNVATGVATPIAALTAGTDYESIACLVDGVNTLSGTVFSDLNGNGTYASPDTPVAGRTVNLYRDTDASGTRNTGDVLVASAVTPAAGTYSFTVAATGAFVVEVQGTPPTGASWTTPTVRAAQFTGYGQSATGLNFGYATFMDLAIGATVDQPAPAQGATVTFTITLTHQFGVAASGVTIRSLLPAGLAFVSATPASGTTYNPTTGVWTIGAVAVGSTRTLVIRATASGTTALTLVSEVTAANELDRDSTPNNGVTSEDDYAAVSVTPTGSTGGGDGGLESNGRLADVLARVLQGRRTATADALATGQSLAPTRFVFGDGPVVAARGGAELRALVPETGPEASVAHEVSPYDLLPVTNAVDIVAADYLRPADGRRLAVVFATATAPGEVYEHTKAVCDRLRGATLEAVGLVDVLGHPLVMTRLRGDDGGLDYAVSFAAYPQPGGGYHIDSRYLLREYAPGSTDSDVLNVQVWGVSPQYAAALVEDVLGTLSAYGDLTFLTSEEAPPSLPRVFVRHGRYADGRVTLEIENPAALSSIRLSGGTLSRTEGGMPEAFEQTLALPAPDANGVSTVTVALGPVFDAAFFVEPEDGGQPDLVYLADGAWTSAADEAATVTAFSVDAQPATDAPEGSRSVERAAHVEGTMGAWAGLVRGLRPAYAAADLSTYEWVEFTAWGEGTGHVYLEKASIETADQFRAPITLTPEPRRIRVPFDALRRDGGAAGFTAEDVAAVSFYLRNADTAAAPFALHVRDVRFGIGTDGAPTPDALALSVAPNPIRGRALVTFSLPEAGTVRVSVYDLLGRRVAVLAEGTREAGHYAESIDGGTLASGVYVVRLDTPTGPLTRRVTVVR